jgi:hypothetical protein
MEYFRWYNVSVKKVILLLLLFLIMGGGALLFQSNRTSQRESRITPTVTITPTTTRVTQQTPTQLPEKNITVSAPKQDQQVGLRFQVTGRARVFENIVTLRVREKQTKNILVTATTTANSPDVGQFGDFIATLDLSQQTSVLTDGEELVIEVYQASPRDGSDVDLVSIPVRFDKE